MKSSRMCESWHIGMGSLHLFSGLVLDSQFVWHIMYVLHFHTCMLGYMMTPSVCTLKGPSSVLACRPECLTCSCSVIHGGYHYL